MTLDGRSDEERHKANAQRRNAIRRTITQLEHQARGTLAPGMREWVSKELAALEMELRNVPAR